MDEYAFEIHTPTGPNGDWVVKDATQTVTAYDESEAMNKADRFANSVYGLYRIRNTRLTKKFTNPDREI